MPDFHVDVQQLTNIYTPYVPGARLMVIKACLYSGDDIIAKVFVRYWPFVCIKYIDHHCVVNISTSTNMRVRYKQAEDLPTLPNMLRSEIARVMATAAPQHMIEVDNHLKQIQKIRVKTLTNV